MKNAVLTFRMSSDQAAKLEAAARFLGKSRATLLSEIVEEFLARSVDAKKAELLKPETLSEDQK